MARASLSILFFVGVGVLLVRITDAEQRSKSASSATTLTDGEVRCPPVIGDSKTGAFYNSRRRREFPFTCYDSVKSARKRDLTDGRRQRLSEVTGWWRVPVAKTSSTCPVDVADGAVVNFFLQARQQDDVLFGELCPSTGRFVGRRLPDRAIFVATSSSDAETLCPEGGAEVTYILDLGKVGPVQAADTTLTRTIRCLKSGAGPLTCDTIWTGVAIREKLHDFFPEVPEDINSFERTCLMTRARCLECH